MLPCTTADLILGVHHHGRMLRELAEPVLWGCFHLFGTPKSHPVSVKAVIPRRVNIYTLSVCQAGWWQGPQQPTAQRMSPERNAYLAAVLGSRLQGISEMFSSCYFLSEQSESNSICGTFLRSRFFFFSKANRPYMALYNLYRRSWLRLLTEL